MVSPGGLRFRGTPLGTKFTNTTGGGNLVGGRQGGVAFRFTLRGGPEMARALHKLGQAVSDEACAQAVLAGGEVLREEWSALTPKFEHYYERSITAVSSPGKKGATGVVFPADIPGLPDNQQPRRYASRLEFGSLAQTKKQLKRGILIPGRARRMQPSLRPAFDNVYMEMVDAIADELRDVIRKAMP